MKNIGYIPLDDRPCNYIWPARLMRGTSFKILVPPRQFMGKFYVPADREKIYSWLRENVKSMDCLILSLDMLIYGGLVASRRPEENGTELMDRLNILEELKKLNPALSVYAFSVLMRISITVDSPESQKNWKNIFEYSKLYYRIKHLKEQNLAGKLKELENSISSKVLRDYLFTRKRNFAINKKNLDFVENGTIDLLVYAQEDAAEYGFHREEQTELKKIIRKRGLSEKVDIFTGTDELGSLLIARYINDVMETTPKLYVDYNYEEGKFVIAPYEDCCLDISVGEHIRVMGGTQGTEPDNSDIIFLCHNSSEVPLDLFCRVPEIFDEKPAKIFLTRFDGYFNNEKPVAVADVFYSNGGDPALVYLMISKGYLKYISSYAAINTTSNSIGFALAQASLSFALKWDEGFRKELVIERIVDDCYYQTLCRPKINSIITGHGMSPAKLTGEISIFEEEIKLFLR